MPVYEYKALNSKGRKVEGIITADSPSGARLSLSQGSVFPTEVREVPGEEKRGREGRREGERGGEREKEKDDSNATHAANI